MNPILQNLRNGNPVADKQRSPVGQMYQAYRSTHDPNILKNAVGSNPIVSSLMKQNVDLEQTFYTLCQQRGVDPEEILRDLR